MSGFADGFLSNLAKLRNARTFRASSWDRTGRNRDNWQIPPGATVVLADIDGPGAITHIWMTQSMRITRMADHAVQDPDMYRKLVLRMYWDGEPNPSINVPLGDFFCLGHSIASNFCALPFSSSTAQHGKFGGGAALNCYLPMPFARHARIELANEGEWPASQYFYIDYELYSEPLAEDIAYLHAQWRRENPTDGWGHGIRVNTPEVDIPNLDGKGNYVFLDARGRGHYIGCNLSVTNLQGTWWGEGDDMIWVDGYKWPPDLHGTGSEDYFNQAWGMQKNAFLFNGSSLFEHDVPGYQVSYNFHLANPVHFRKSILVTMEHGHANHLANDWASTAYWYQAEPHRPFGLQPVEQRLPIRGDIGVIAAGPETMPRGRETAATRRAKALAERKQVRQTRGRLADARRRAAQERQWLKDEIAKAKGKAPKPRAKARGRRAR